MHLEIGRAVDASVLLHLVHHVAVAVEGGGNQTVGGGSGTVSLNGKYFRFVEKVDVPVRHSKCAFLRDGGEVDFWFVDDDFMGVVSHGDVDASDTDIGTFDVIQSEIPE